MVQGTSLAALIGWVKPQDMEPPAPVSLAEAERILAQVRLKVVEQNAFAPDGTVIHANLLEQARTRVAATRPELTAAMCEGNRAALLSSLDDALGRLGAARGSLASTGGLLSTLTAGHDGREALDAARRARREVRIDLEGTPAEFLEAMREVGRTGGRVIGWTPEALEAALGSED